MKTILLTLLVVLATPVVADQYVRPHIRKDGTFVDGHFRSSPNSTKFDNYSTRGNSNPYTGQRGYESPDPTPRINLDPMPSPFDQPVERRRSRY